MCTTVVFALGTAFVRAMAPQRRAGGERLPTISCFTFISTVARKAFVLLIDTPPLCFNLNISRDNNGFKYSPYRLFFVFLSKQVNISVCVSAITNPIRGIS